MNPADWAPLWRELALDDLMSGDRGEREMVARWRNLAHRIDSGERPDADPLRDFVAGRLEPGDTVLDVGAGIGRWTVPLAAGARQVTAIEPVTEMRDVLLERIAARRLANVSVVAAPWAEAEVEVHDSVVAVHSTYTSPDLLAFVRKMEAHARRGCYLVLRLPAHDGVIGELSERIRGRWHDSPNFIVGYNLLLASGYCPNVVVEPEPARTWEDGSIDEAMARAKRHLHIADGKHDSVIRDVLTRRLARANGAYRWPDCMRSAHAWWEKGPV